MKAIRSQIVAATGLLILGGCAGNDLGGLGDILGGVLGTAGSGAPQQGELLAEIREVDEGDQAIHVRADDGQEGAVLFDQNTVVVYQQQQYPVAALERGDLVRMQVQQVEGNRLYTPRIDVRQSVQERTGQASAQLRQVSGTLGRIDHQNGFFELQVQGGTYTVVLPGNAQPSTVERFHGLRSGEWVTVEGTLTGTARIDLYRFV